MQNKTGMQLLKRETCLDIPHAHTLVQRRRQNEVIPGVKAGGHDVVVVAGKHLGEGRWVLSAGAALKLVNVARTDMQLRFCQFHMRIVWSSDALTIHGC